MGAQVSTHIDPMVAAGVIDDDSAALEHRINEAAVRVQEGLKRAKVEAKQAKQARQARERLSGVAPLPPPPPAPKDMVSDEVVAQFEEQSAADVQLVKQYIRRAMAAKPKLDRCQVTAAGRIYLAVMPWRPPRRPPPPLQKRDPNLPVITAW